MANKKQKPSRRSLGDALTPEAKAFLDLGQGSASESELQQEQHKQEGTSTESASKKEASPELAPSDDAATQERAPLIPARETASKLRIQGDMSLNTRITAEISHALMKAHMQRRMERRTATQREIVEEALTDWLLKNDFLP